VGKSEFAKALEEQFQNEIEKQIEKMDEYRQTLYHYTGIHSLMGMVETNNLWMSKGTFLNDSSELFYFQDVLKAVLQKMDIPHDEIRWRMFRGELERAMDRFLSEIESGGFEVYVFSLSHAPDSLALWYNYAKGEGYNLGFLGEDLLAGIRNSPEKGTLLHGLVKYSRQKQELILMALLLGTFQLMAEFEGEEAEQDLAEHFFTVITTCAIFFKDPTFASEEEYRIAVINSPGGARTGTSFRAQNGVIIPYITVNFKERLPISHITIGPKNNIDIAKRGIEQYLKTKGYDLEKITIQKSVAALRY
jgi:hypothetical protein